jgi:hypothetical protein
LLVHPHDALEEKNYVILNTTVNPNSSPGRRTTGRQRGRQIGQGRLVTVTTVVPNTGGIAGGTACTVSGYNLTAATGATVGGVAGTAFSVVDDSHADVRHRLMRLEPSTW